MTHKVIWKYGLGGGHSVIQMPREAKVRHVEVQREVPCLWVECEPDLPIEDRTFISIGTGHPFNDKGLEYVGTCLSDRGVFVLHVYEVKS